MIELITGRSGSGKSFELYNHIKKLGEEERAVLVVPEQSSFYNEKKLLSDLGDKKAKNIEVLSFRRLCSNITEKYKGVSGKRIDDGIKAVLMNMAIENAPAEGGELELYAKKGKIGLKKTLDLVDPMLTAVNEYKMCMISPQQLYSAANKVDSRILSSKLRDSARIYAAYNALLENTYEDPDDDLTRLYDLLGEHDYFSGMTVFIDSFYGFSAQELKIIERIFTQAENVCITICCDKASASTETTIFDEPARTYRELIRIALKCGKECHVNDLSETGRRFASQSLKAAEENLFYGYRDGEIPEKTDNDGSVRMYEAADLYDEINYTAKEIFRLVHEQRYKYNEIEIIARDLDMYKSVIRSEFPKYNIPYFLSDSECLDNKAFIRMILSAFDAVHGNYDTEAILRIAKSGFTKITENEAFELENYVYIWSIRGKRWLSPFTMPVNGMEHHKDGEEDLKAIEETRQKLVEPLEKFAKALNNTSDGAQISFAVFQLIEDYGSKYGFKNYIESVRKERNEMQAERESAVWDRFMSVLDKMYELLSGKNTDSRTYLELLRIYLRKTPVSDIPQTLNSVTAGIAGTIRSASPKAVFALGCNEGVFPAQPSAVGIFTDSERRLLREECAEEDRLPLYDSIFGNSLKEKFNVYTTLCAPSEKLFICWHLQDLSGNACMPSIIKNEILTILKGTSIEKASPLNGSSPVESIFFTSRQSFDICAKTWRDQSGFAPTLKEYFSRSEEYGDKTKAIARSAEKEAFALRDGKRIKKLFGSPLRLSSTKLDQFSNCKFAYFCRYGLEAYPIKKAAMDGSLYGTVMHYIFEKTLSEHSIEEFSQMQEDTLKNIIKTNLDTFIRTSTDENEMGSRFSALCGRIKRNAFKTLARMQEQFKVDKFRPVDYELRIGAEDDSGIPAYEIELPMGDKLVVTGFVDRVDTAEYNGQQYLRIIDYKTGDDDFSFSNVANGIKIQMLLYLSAILRNSGEKYSDGKVLLPAGVLYVPSTARTVVADSGSSYDLGISEKAEKDNFRMRGVLLNNRDILEMMEQDLEGKFIPAAKTSKNVLSSRSSVISENDFQTIFRYIDICLKNMGTELYMGNIEAYPEKHACRYCDYKSVCRFEEGDKMREFINFDKNQALNFIIKKEAEDNDGSKGV